MRRKRVGKREGPGQVLGPRERGTGSTCDRQPPASGLLAPAVLTLAMWGPQDRCVSLRAMISCSDACVPSTGFTVSPASPVPIWSPQTTRDPGGEWVIVDWGLGCVFDPVVCKPHVGSGTPCWVWTEGSWVGMLIHSVGLTAVLMFFLKFLSRRCACSSSPRGDRRKRLLG